MRQRLSALKVTWRPQKRHISVILNKYDQTLTRLRVNVHSTMMLINPGPT